MNYSQPNITDEDIDAVVKVLKSGMIAGRTDVVREFEEAIADYAGYKYAVAVNSATTGLMLAYRAVFGDGDLYADLEIDPVIDVPALTFIATANAAIENNVQVNPIDVDYHTLVADRDDIAVSFAGYPVQNADVADDAHYLVPGMGFWKKHKASVVSTHAVKPLTTGEGGVVFTNYENVYHHVRMMSDHGIVDGETWGYGGNYRMPAMNAALGLSQLKRARADLLHRHSIASYYYRTLNDAPVTLPAMSFNHAWHLFVIRCADKRVRDGLKSFMSSRGYRCQIHYKPIHLFDHIAGNTVGLDLPNSENAYETGLSIPLFSAMTDEMAVDVAQAILDFYDENN